MAIELFNQNGHVCLMFAHLSDEGGEAVQANQFLVIDGDQGAVIDPGGNMAFNELLLTIGRYFPPNKLTEILASHADPDIIASLDRWMTSTQATLYISKLWERFAPHFCKPGKTAGRIIGIPDPGMRIKLGRSEIIALQREQAAFEKNRDQRAGIEAKRQAKLGSKAYKAMQKQRGR